MIKIKKNLISKKYQPRLGDLLQCEKYIVGEVKKEDVQHPLILAQFNNNPWKALGQLGIDYEELMKTSQYMCYITGNKFNWFLPYFVLCGSSKKIYRDLFPSDLFFNINFDKEWSRNNILCLKDTEDEDYWKRPSAMQLAMLGHGYTECTLPMDGSNDIEICFVNLSNGDKLAGFTWIWYNK